MLSLGENVGGWGGGCFAFSLGRGRGLLLVCVWAVRGVCFEGGVRVVACGACGGGGSWRDGASFETQTMAVKVRRNVTEA
jgi:hypothetical protein